MQIRSGRKVKSCAFFGHRVGNYTDVEGHLKEILIHLIEKEGVAQFYSGGRGAFDQLGVRLVAELKKRYPDIKITRVLSYIPKEKEEYTPLYFDDSVYLLERQVPAKYAIIETNKLLVDKADFIISGVKYSFGGAARAVEYAKKKKEVIELYG